MVVIRDPYHCPGERGTEPHLSNRMLSGARVSRGEPGRVASEDTITMAV